MRLLHSASVGRYELDMIEMDPTLELSLAMYSRPGVYALLLGSGVSSTAGIPTGWSVLCDLIEQVATADSSSTGGNPERWYKERYGSAPNYSEIIESLGSTPSERQQLIRPYFEPDKNSEDPDLKQPTKAHLAIARMMKSGMINLVLTTNFDRLLEQACEREGVVPVVVADEHAISGMIPIQHATNPLIVKLHGDYLDSRIRNTESEIGESYPEPIEKLLTRIFDEFGLIVCGWSAEWDHALKNAIAQTPGRRFATYWIEPGALSDAANSLISHRDAKVQRCTADTLFPQLESKLESLRELRTHDPMHPQLAVSQAKRYIDMNAKVKLHDLLFQEADRVRIACDDEDMAWSIEPSQERFLARSRKMIASCSSLVPTLSTVAHHSPDFAGTIIQPLLDLLQQRRRYENQYFNVWRDLSLLPTALSVYAMGIGFLRENRYDLIAKLLNEPKCYLLFDGVGKDRLIPYIGWGKIFSYEFAQGFYESNKITPGAEFAWEQIRSMLLPVFYSDQMLEHYYDELEVMIGCKGGWGGRWLWKMDSWSGEESHVLKAHKELLDRDVDHPWIKNIVFASVKDLRSTLEEMLNKSSY